MRCSNCGKELPDQARFCKYCGTEQVHVAISEPVKQKKKRIIWPMILILLILLMVGGIGGYAHFNGKSVFEIVQGSAGRITDPKKTSDVLVGKAAYSSDGSLIASDIYKYSEDGTKAERSTWRSPQYRSTTYFDLSAPYDISKIRNYTIYSETGEVIQEGTYEDGGKKATTKLNRDGMQTETTNIYDDNGRIIQSTTFQDGVLTEEIRNTWNEDGKMLSRLKNGEPDTSIKQDLYRRRDDQGNTTAYCNISYIPSEGSSDENRTKHIITIYKDYDPGGNCIKKVTYSNGSLLEVEILIYKRVDDLDEELTIPDQRVIEENLTDDYSLFAEEIRQSLSD